MDEATEADLVGLIYDAALDRRPWTEVAARIAQAFDGLTFTLSVQNPIGRAVDMVASHGVSEAEARDYVAYYAPFDIWATEAYRKHIFDTALSNREIISETAFERSLFFNEFLRPRVWGIFHMMGALMSLPRGDIGLLGVHRPRSCPSYENDDVQRLDRLLPHLRRALEIRQRLHHLSGLDITLHSLLDRLREGAVLLTGTGTVLQANGAAERHLAARDGLEWAGRGVRAAIPAEDRRLQALIRTAAAIAAGTAPEGVEAGGHLRLSRPSQRRAYRLLVSPLGRDHAAVDGERPAVLLLISDPEEDPALDPAAIGQVFGLTPAESRIALGLALGKSLSDMAAATGTSVNTARTLLSRAMAKTETNSQAGLVAALLRAGLLVRAAPGGGPDRGPGRGEP